MISSTRWKMAVWIVWTLVYAPGLGAASIAIYRSVGTSVPQTLVGFDPANPIKATAPGLLRLKFHCNRPSSQVKITVAASRLPGSAREGVDFTTPSMPLTLDFNGDERYIDINVLEANRAEDIPLRLTLTTDGETGVDPESAAWVVTLPRRGVPLPSDVEVSFAKSGVEGTEGKTLENVFSDFIRFSRPISKPITIPYRIDGGSPLALIVDGKGETSASFPFAIPNDNIFQGDRSHRLTLLNTSGVKVGNPSRATVVVHDDEPEPKIRIEGLVVKAPVGSEKAFSFRVAIEPMSTSPVSVRFRVASNGPCRFNPLDRIAIKPGQSYADVDLKPISGPYKTPGESIGLTFDEPSGGRLVSSPAALTLSVEDVKEKGNLLIVVIETERFVETRSLDPSLRLAHDRSRDVLVGGGYIVVRKSGESAVWPLDQQEPPIGEGEPFHLGGADSVAPLLNSAFDEAVRWKPKMENPNFEIVILWPSRDSLRRYNFNPASIRWPAGNRPHLYVVGCVANDFGGPSNVYATIPAAFEKLGGSARFLSSPRQIEDLKAFLAEDLKPKP